MGLGDNDVGEMFYAGDASASVAIAGGVIATIFGGIHCVAWSFQFPEQLLWRTASLSITCSPTVLVCAVLVFKQLQSLYGLLRLFGIKLPIATYLRSIPGRLPMAIGTAVFAVLYVLSRVALLVIAFMSLRSLPPGAYETVHWTTFIPHV